jgi:flagellar hook-length control protein FliK
VSAGAASVPRPPEACPRDAGRSADSRIRGAKHQADDGFADALTAIADDRAGPRACSLGPPGKASAKTARTATAEGHEGESDSPAQTGIEQPLVAAEVAGVTPTAPAETLEAVPPAATQAQTPRQEASAAAIPVAEPTHGEPVQAAATSPSPAESPTQETKESAESGESAAASGLVTPPGEGPRRPDGKTASTSHRRTPVQSAVQSRDDAVAKESLEASGEKDTEGRSVSRAPSGAPTTLPAGVSPAPATDGQGVVRHARPTAQSHTDHHEDRAGVPTTAVVAPPAAKEASGGGVPAPEAHVVTPTEPTQAAQPTVQPAAPAAAARQVDVGAKASGTAPHGRTQLHELVAKVRETIRVTVREERTEARITLHPAELGEVRIRISYGPGGISASIVADSGRAAQTLAQASPELRRMLEQHGLTLQSVDVQVGGDAAQLGAENGAGGAAAGSDPDARRESSGDTEAAHDETTEPEPSRDVPLGAHVDVLA